VGGGGAKRGPRFSMGKCGITKNRGGAAITGCRTPGAKKKKLVETQNGGGEGKQLSAERLEIRAKKGVGSIKNAWIFGKKGKTPSKTVSKA